ncbi:HEPN domain-containing protein [Larkinella rosea]|uniref:HEPN domain-containing protein n=1 Tax=Larkinella rosea TaxID=2025312 RepID=A0A3P1BSR9_9BACT|nr:HEPN domain-containing protein [Larkinella rosea]
MTALLLSENEYAKTHKGTITKFNELFVKSGLFNKEAAQLVSNAYILRQKADYDLEVEISEDDARDLVKRARVFLTEVTLYFEQNLPEPN